jgi:D-beta-D-heptose 7-phosphate kinase / D-beta-D-heptose 1-phosphate adenosyltransferase
VIPYPDFANHTVVVVGDIILDRYIWGDVDRISPEAPVPVIRVKRKTMNLGGAGNVAMNLKGLGCRQILMGTRGDDRDGDCMASILKEEMIAHHLVTIPGHPTTTKTRIVGQNQQLARLDEETPEPVVDRYATQLKEQFDRALPTAGAVIISDYGKGAITPDTAGYIIQQCKRLDIPVFVDPKGISWEKYQGAFCITPNSAELNRVAPFTDTDDTELEAQARKIIDHLALDFLLVTRGSKGISLFRQGVAALKIPAEAKEVFDVSGAGDTVIATIAAAFAAGLTMQDAAALANMAAGIVIGKIGTQPIDTMVLKQASQDRALAGAEKIVTKKPALDRIADWRAHHDRIVFTNGCFDILHVGHIKLLHAAAAEGDRLIVGLNSDRSVRNLKGDKRPIVPEEERAALLSSIKGVDLVVLFDQATPIELIQAFTPDVIVKGGDYTPETVVGHEIVLAHGGKVVIVPLIQGVSTTHVIESIDTSQATR